MKLALLLLAALLMLAANGKAQVIKSLGYNTTNGNVVYSGTNILTFTNSQIGILEPGENSVFLRNESGSLRFDAGDGQAMTLSATLAIFSGSIEFDHSTNIAITRTNLELGLPALTNTSNVTIMRALGGSTNTNQPFSGSISLTNTNTLVFSNGILLSQ